MANLVEGLSLILEQENLDPKKRMDDVVQQIFYRLAAAKDWSTEKEEWEDFRTLLTIFVQRHELMDEEDERWSQDLATIDALATEKVK